MATRIVERPAPQLKSITRGTPRAFPARWVAILVISDVALFVVASCLGALIGFHHWDSPRIVGHLLVAEALYVALWVIVFDRLGLYRRTYALSMKDELYYTIAALMLGTIPQLVLFTIYPGISTSRIALVFALLFSIVLVGSSRAMLHRIRHNEWFKGRRRVSLVGTSDHIERVLESLELPDDAETHLLAHVLEVASSERIRLAFAPPAVIRYCYDLSLQTDGRQVLIVPARLRACSPRAQLVKRLMDVVFGSIALLLFSPVMLVAAIAIVIDSGWPILYSQERAGVGGKVFRILKFRSMRQDAERAIGAVWATDDDPRKTRIGSFLRRFSIDELPQLFNVLRGDMSLVGPRPERPMFVDLFRGTLPRYDQRHLVRPGITGWSHVHMKRNVDTSAAGERLAYDLQYLENWSPYLDVAVLFQTLCEFLFHRAA